MTCRVEFRSSFWVVQRGDPELQFTPNVQCHEGCCAIMSRCSCFHAPSLKISLQLQFHRRADMEHEPSQRALIIISQRPHRFIIRLVLGRNLCCPRSRLFHMLRSIPRMLVIFRSCFRKFRIQDLHLAQIHSATSFQPQPERFDVSAPGMSQDASFFERSSLIQEKRTSDLLSKWHISFKGEKRKNPKSFIADLTNCKETYKLTLDEIVKVLPSALDEESWQWFCREYQFWKTYEDFVDAFRLQYSFEDYRRDCAKSWRCARKDQVRRFRRTC